MPIERPSDPRLHGGFGLRVRPFGGLLPRNRERFFDYYLGKVEVEPDPTTQVLHLSVSAFDPFSARDQRAAASAVGSAGQSPLQPRTHRRVAVAEDDARTAQRRARDAAVALASYRNRAGIVDPEKEAESRLQGIAKLEDDLVTVRTQLQQMEQFTPAAPQIPYLRSQVATLQREIAGRRSGVAGGRNSLSAAGARYQVLLLDSELAGKQLAAALMSLQMRMPRPGASAPMSSGSRHPACPITPSARVAWAACWRCWCSGCSPGHRLRAVRRHPRASRGMTASAGPSLRHSLRVQGRVLWALLLREMLTRYGRHNIGFLWLFVEPMLFTLGVAALWTAAKAYQGSNLPIVAFALTGYSSVLLWRNMPGRCIGALGATCRCSTTATSACSTSMSRA